MQQKRSLIQRSFDPNYSSRTRHQELDRFVKELLSKSDTHQIQRISSLFISNMGQSLSAIKITRATHKDIQHSRESVEQCLSPHNEGPESLLNSKDDLQSIFTKTALNSKDDLSSIFTEAALNSKDDLRFNSTEAASEESQINLSLERDKVSTILTELPTDTILGVAEYLAPKDQISLYYSCRRIQERMVASLTHILAKEESMTSLSNSALSVESRNKRVLERLKLRSVLDRDGRNSSLKTFCGGCEAAHDSSLFSISSLKQLSTERRCLGNAGRVWICPHHIVDYDQALDLKEAQSHGCEDNWVSLHGRHSSRDRSVDFGYSIYWPVVIVYGECVPSREEVKKALGPLSAPICPHLRLNDACIAECYFPDCQRLRCGLGETDPVPDCGCCSCSSYSRFRTICDYCGTQVLFCIKSYVDDGIEALHLVLRRSIRDVRSPTDRSWICQVADPADFEAYERAWHATDAECLEKVGMVFEAHYSWEE